VSTIRGKQDKSGQVGELALCVGMLLAIDGRVVAFSYITVGFDVSRRVTEMAPARHLTAGRGMR
jgi:hypothetical protein